MVLAFESELVTGHLGLSIISMKQKDKTENWRYPSNGGIVCKWLPLYDVFRNLKKNFEVNYVELKRIIINPIYAEA